MTTPLASVILITFNHERFIARAIESILAQATNFEFEVIIVDDCSTDGTLEIVQRYQVADPRIRIERNPSNFFGTAAGFNAVQDAFTVLANGRYVFELEGDDFWANPKKMQRQVDFMESNPDVDLCFHDWLHVDVDGNPLNVSMPLSARRSYSADELASFSYAWILWGTCCVRKSSNRWPVEVALSISTDMFIPYIYGSTRGGAAYLDNCGPLAYRQGVGVWSTAKERKKLEYKLQTALAIVLLLVRRDNWAAVAQQVVHRLLPALINLGILRRA